MERKKFIVVGPCHCGKSLLCARLQQAPYFAGPTQSVQLVGHGIDTPGAYLQNRAQTAALILSAAQAHLVLLLHDATTEANWFSPGQAGMFPAPTVGVVTKTDLAAPAGVQRAAGLLERAGASTIFAVSSQTGAGLSALQAYLEQHLALRLTS